MTIGATVKTKVNNIVMAKVRDGGIIDSSSPVTLKTSSVTSTGAEKLAQLKDVVTAGETSGSTLIYDEGTNEYYVRKLDLAEVTGNLDGGTF
jgi:hypothetical protein